MNKEVRALCRELERQGLDVRRTARGHFRVYRGKEPLVTMSATPSCPRALTNTRADLRRAGVAI